MVTLLNDLVCTELATIVDIAHQVGRHMLDGRPARRRQAIQPFRLIQRALFVFDLDRTV